MNPSAAEQPRSRTRWVAGVILVVLCVLGLVWAAYWRANSESRLIAALRDGNPEVRRSAAGALGDVRSSRVVGPLIAALDDTDARVRFYAAGALAKTGDPRAVEPLLAKLEDADSDVRWGAAFALRDIGAPAVPPLIASLKDEDARVRRGAAAALGEIKDPRSVEPLIVALEEDADPDVRWISAGSLATIGAPALERLAPVLRQPDLAVIAKAYPFFILRAEPGSEDVLVRTLNARGTAEMAGGFLNCGNPALAEAARKWAEAHGYSAVSVPTRGGGGAQWGSRR